MAYETILVEVKGKVGIITLNRPQALNALNVQLIADINAALDGFERDDTIGCVVMTGSEKAFAAGADIKQMQERSYPGTYLDDKFADWDRIGQRRKPIIAAVAGFALGGGCELAMMADILVCGDNAKFGQPEIKLGVMPGMGGSQRLVRAIGKAKAMDMCLTGRMMAATEAEQSGLVARVFPAADLVDEALKLAATIAAMPPLAAIAGKEAINASFEMPLAQGVNFERRLFHGLFGSQDQKEGMAAFIEKRPGNWTGK